ncbi:hypothetical protein [Kitasatospora cheerisanensis]|uniref:Uncharacterized protein n=1 Tax=Kitasatospora cheerisanensis KCTC 2395 TaxID=1348663 RepID=A0A066YQ26_9ACTN|nr:hypothetical protein [Kitasatospora cheerisanensis]KDN82089.1 hypothetical protein KCH_62430 [Kitasatospora cheerisanensis KCTC 2395]
MTADGRTGQLLVTVEHGWHRGFRDDPATAFGTLTASQPTRRTADGALYAVIQFNATGPDGAGGLQWIARGLLPDGTLVTAKLWTYGPDHRITTDPGVLDQERLTALVTAPSWARA